MEKIDKTQAIKRLEAIEKETEELKKIINRKNSWQDVTNVEEACTLLGPDDEDVREYITMAALRYTQASLSPRTINYKALELCIKAINTESSTWIPDWNNPNQKKWYNWFERKNSGWSLRFVDYCCCRSCVGSGLCYETEEKAQHGAKHFKKYYDIWLGN